MNDLDSYKISGIWVYKVMQILLILSILPAIVIQNPKFLFITGVIFIINRQIARKKRCKSGKSKDDW